jgi:hypothetical protein
MDGSNALPVVQEWRERLDAITCSVRYVARSFAILVEKNGVIWKSAHVPKRLVTPLRIRTIHDITMSNTFTVMNANTEVVKNAIIDDQEQKVVCCVNAMNAKTSSPVTLGNVMIVTKSFASIVIAISTRYIGTSSNVSVKGG